MFFEFGLFQVWIEEIVFKTQNFHVGLGWVLGGVNFTKSNFAQSVTDLGKANGLSYTPWQDKLFRLGASQNYSK